MDPRKTAKILEIVDLIPKAEPTTLEKALNMEREINAKSRKTCTSWFGHNFNYESLLYAEQGVTLGIEKCTKCETTRVFDQQDYH